MRSPSSIKSEIEDWFKNNPDKEITILELAEYCQCSGSCANQYVNELSDELRLVRSRTGKTEMLWVLPKTAIYNRKLISKIWTIGFLELD